MIENSRKEALRQKREEMQTLAVLLFEKALDVSRLNDEEYQFVVTAVPMDVHQAAQKRNGKKVVFFEGKIIDAAIKTAELLRTEK